MPLLKILPGTGSGTGIQGQWTTRPSGTLVDDATVAQLSDQTGHGRHMLQATGANKPTSDDDIAAGVFVLECATGQFMAASQPAGIKDIFVTVWVPAAPTADFTIVARDTSAVTTKTSLELTLHVA
jgi:hypothetical protein